jgi:hypothetical protein
LPILKIYQRHADTGYWGGVSAALPFHDIVKLCAREATEMTGEANG